MEDIKRKSMVSKPSQKIQDQRRKDSAVLRDMARERSGDIKPEGGRNTKIETPEQATDLLKQFQQSQYDSLGTPPIRGETGLGEVKDIQETLEGLKQPAVFDSKKKFQELYASHGVSDLETELNDIKAQEEEVKANMRLRTTKERGETVSQGVIAGRISEVERQEYERLDYIQRQKQSIVDELKTQYGMVEQIMEFEQTDFQNAQISYNQKFSQTLQVIEVTRGLKKDQMTATELSQDKARANLQIVYNQLSSGGMTRDKLSDEQKTFIQKLEIKSGLPLGLFQMVQNNNPDAEVVSTTTREDNNGNRFVDIVTKNRETGELEVNNMLIGGVKQSSKYDIVGKYQRTDQYGNSYLDIATRNENGSIGVENIYMGQKGNKDGSNREHDRSIMRTDRHNNPLASKFYPSFVKRLEQAGFIEGVDFWAGDTTAGIDTDSVPTIAFKDVETGVSANAHLMGTGMADTWYANPKYGGNYIMKNAGVNTSADFSRLTPEQQQNLIMQIYKHEGGKGDFSPLGEPQSNVDYVFEAWQNGDMTISGARSLLGSDEEKDTFLKKIDDYRDLGRSTATGATAGSFDSVATKPSINKKSGSSTDSKSLMNDIKREIQEELGR